MKNNNIIERQKELERELRENSTLATEKLFQKYKTSQAGLSVVEIDDKLEEYGPNTIEI